MAVEGSILGGDLYAEKVPSFTTVIYNIIKLLTTSLIFYVDGDFTLYLIALCTNSSVYLFALRVFGMLIRSRPSVSSSLNLDYAIAPYGTHPGLHFA